MCVKNRKVHLVVHQLLKTGKVITASADECG